MPRRIIYIKNPSQGSHFRTLGGAASASKPKQPRAPKAPKAPKQPKPPPYDDGSHGYMPGHTTDSDWFLHYDQPIPLDYGSYTGSAVGGPYSQEFYLAPYQAAALDFQESSLGQKLYDIFVHGEDPGSAHLLLPLGTTGTPIPFSDLFGAEIDKFGGPLAAPPISGINPAYLNVKPKKPKKKKASWLNPTGEGQ